LLVLIEYETSLANPPLSNLPKITELGPKELIETHTSVVQLPDSGSKRGLSGTVS
jgi:hypothetical protein